ncbi:HYR domain-containing protein, partial [Aquiflexum lacus]|uniref:HYR domain-containing protein n=1 Tax=Aquiflexum lacus TaxID=2483805 RepID=UPI00189422D0
MKKSVYLLILVFFLFLTLKAQTPGQLDLSFNEDVIDAGSGANNRINKSILFEDGRILIAGDFTEYNGVKKNYLARLNPDGTLDKSYPAGTGPDWVISDMVALNDGKVLIGGAFSTFNGQSINRIARLNQDGSLDETFDPGQGTNVYVQKLALQPDDKIIIVGNFSSFDGFARNKIARLDSDGNLDLDFDPGSFIGGSNIIESVEIQNDGKILFGGLFSTVGEFSKNNLVRINSDGSLDLTFESDIDSYVYSIKEQLDGKILIGGTFLNVNGQSQNRLARLNSNGSLDETFDVGSGPSNVVYFIDIFSDDEILIGGAFSFYNSVYSEGLVLLNSIGSLKENFNANLTLSGITLDVARQLDNKIIVVGSIGSFNGIPRDNIVRLLPDGSLDTTFNPPIGADNPINALHVQKDGKILLGGTFQFYDGLPKGRINRLNSNGQQDESFDTGTGFNIDVRVIKELPNEKLLVGGFFTQFNGDIKLALVRLNNDGSLDNEFNSSGSGPGNWVNDIILRTDGKILIFGQFTSYNLVQNINRIALLNEDGSLNNDFNSGTGANNVIFSAAMQTDGKIIILGSFTEYNGIPINRIARLNSDGSLDETFDVGTGLGQSASSIVVQPDGKILIAGNFFSYNSESVVRIVRLNPDGSLDSSFNPGSVFTEQINSLALQSDGKILVGTNRFSSITNTNFTRLNPNGTIDSDFDSGSGPNQNVNALAIQNDGRVLLAGNFTGYNDVSRIRIARVFSGLPEADTQAPVPDLESLPDIIAACGLEFEELTVPTATDNVDGQVMGTTDESIFPISEQGEFNIIWRFTDQAGNTSVQEQRLIIQDTEKPVIGTVSNITATALEGTCQAVITITTPEVTDNCTPPTATGTRSDGLSLEAPYPVGETIITWTAEDEAGNEADPVVQTITVLDDQPPLISVPAEIIVPANAGQCFANGVNLGTPITSDNCGVGSVSNDAPSSFPVGLTEVLWTVVDVWGNSAQALQLVTVLDNELPFINSPADLAIGTDAGLCSATEVNLGEPEFGDNCPGVEVSNNAPDIFPFGETVVTWTVKDASGNENTSQQTVTVNDNEKPGISAVSQITQTTDPGACDAEIEITAPTVSDNCDNPTATGTRSDGLGLDAPYPVGTTQITWTATDASGNEADEVVQTVTVEDNEAPIITAPANISIQIGESEESATDVDLGTPTTSDNCGVEEVSNDAPESFPVGTTMVTWTVTDVNGNSETAQQTVTVSREILPTITAPANITIDTDEGTCEVTEVELGTATVTGDDIPADGISNDAPESFPIGSTIVTWTVIDGNGNTATAQQTVTVEDNEVPVIATVSDIVRSADDGTCDAEIEIEAPSVSDNCGSPTVTGTRSDGQDLDAPYPVGSTQITWKASDTSGNEAEEVVQNVRVEDNEAPTIVAPANISIQIGEDDESATDVELGTPTTSDNCGVDVVVNLAPESFPIGTTTVTWTVTDVNGNTATADQVITVSREILPTITAPANITIDADEGSCEVEDVDLGTPTVTGEDIPSYGISNDAPESFPIGSTIVTWTVVDGNGNTATAQQTVTVEDNEAPVISAVSEINRSTDMGTCDAEIEIEAPTVSDNCDNPTATGTRSDGLALDAPYPVGNTQITWTATDALGNEAEEVVQTVTVEDNEAPVITAPANITIQLQPGQESATDVELGTPTTSDNCSVDVAVNLAPEFFPIGTTTVTWTVTDDSGNTATDTQTVTVLPADTETDLPTVTAPADILVDTDKGICEAMNVDLGISTFTGDIPDGGLSNDAPTS